MLQATCFEDTWVDMYYIQADTCRYTGVYLRCARSKTRCSYDELDAMDAQDGKLDKQKSQQKSACTAKSEVSLSLTHT